MFKKIAKQLLLCVLAFTLAKLPMPWFHHHGALDVVELSSHRRAYHDVEGEVGFADNWHLHWLFVPPPVGDDDQESPSDLVGSYVLCDGCLTESASPEIASSRDVSRLCDRHRFATVDDTRHLVPFQSDRNHLGGIFLRAGLRTHLQLAVWLI